MKQAVFLGSNFEKAQLENSIVWSCKFKTVAGQYVYAVDLTYPPQKIAATRFATSESPGSRIGTKALVETTEADGILFAVRVTLDPEAMYQECDVCGFLQQHLVVHTELVHSCVSEEEFLNLLPKLEELEAKNQFELTRHVSLKNLEQYRDQVILKIRCLNCFAVFGCRVAGEREPQGVHITQGRYSFVED